MFITKMTSAGRMSTFSLFAEDSWFEDVSRTVSTVEVKEKKSKIKGKIKCMLST